MANASLPRMIHGDSMMRLRLYFIVQMIDGADEITLGDVGVANFYSS